MLALPAPAVRTRPSGPESLTSADIADRLSAVAGRIVTHVPIMLADLRSNAAGAGAPEWIRQHVVELMDLYARDESVGVVTWDVEAVTGRAPGTLAGFLEDHRTHSGEPHDRLARRRPPAPHR